MQALRSKQQGRRRSKTLETDFSQELLLQNQVKQIGNYLLGKTIGEGTFGKVKVAVHRPTGLQVAIKIVDKIHAPQVIQEIETWRHLHHPNIVQLIEVLTSENKIYMVCEYIENGEIFEYITKYGKRSEEEGKKLFKQMVQAIQYCHEKLLVHRDLKLENILLDLERGQIKLIDFGFMKNLDHSQKLLETFCGSVAYAAPEMIKGQRYTGPEADIWSLGVILYTICCGFLPFDDDIETKIHQKILNREFSLPETLSEDLQDLIIKILQLDPKQRLSIPAILQHPWLSNVKTEEELEQEEEIPEETYLSPSEKQSLYQSPPLMQFLKKQKTQDKLIIHQLSQLGFDTKSMLHSLQSDACDSLSAMFYLLKMKKERQHFTSTLPSAQSEINDELAQSRSSSPVHSFLYESLSSPPPHPILFNAPLSSSSDKESVFQTVVDAGSPSTSPLIALDDWLTETLIKTHFPYKSSSPKAGISPSTSQIPFETRRASTTTIDMKNQQTPLSAKSSYSDFYNQVPSPTARRNSIAFAKQVVEVNESPSVSHLDNGGMFKVKERRHTKASAQILMEVDESEQ